METDIVTYDRASSIVKQQYIDQAQLILSSLDTLAVIELAKLHNQGVYRKMNNLTINRLSQMDPHRQVGYLANPFLEWIISDFIFRGQKKEIVDNTKTTINQNNTVPKPNINNTIPQPLQPLKPIPKPKESSESSGEENPLMDFF